MLKKLTAAAAALALAAALPFGVCALSSPFDAFFDGGALFLQPGAYAYDALGALTVRPADGARTVPAGTWLAFDVTRDGAALPPSAYTVEVVGGADVAEAYANGEIIAFGDGEVVVRVFLDDDPSVEGWGAVTVTPATGEDPYALFYERAAAADGASDAAFEQQLSGFPESYRPYLRALHQKYPAWVFEPFYTGLDFGAAVAAESTGDRMLTLRLNFSDFYKSRAAGDYDAARGQYIVKDPGWVSVNGTAVSWFMDPRNMLDERYVFQFELLTYDADVHSIEGVEAILGGTFMHEAACDYLDAGGAAVSAGMSYAEAILDAARQTDVSPYYLAAKIRGEIGSTPTDSVTGSVDGYKGVYNFYNIGASDGEGNIERGLAWAAREGAYNRPWTSPQASILGGAQYLAEEYIAAGQYTGYLQKFNVNADSDGGLYQNQYMTNVSGAAGQAASAAAGYDEAGALSSAIVFSIPVYENMPGETARITAFDVGAPGIVNADTALRTGAAPWYDAAGTLAAGDVVTVVRSVPTAAATIRSYMTYPYWYEVRVTRGGETLAGYVAADFVNMCVSRVLAPGATTAFAPSAQPQGNDDMVYYLSRNEAVATVSAGGTVTAVAPGTAVILAYTAGGVMAQLRVAVR